MKPVKRHTNLNDTDAGAVPRLAALFEVASSVLGDDDAAQRWLTNKQSVLGNVTPLELAKTRDGSDYMRWVLNAIEYGLPS
jgi:putative toxin-antitoxin system antitoxin component (TIGR02293 family)